MFTKLAIKNLNPFVYKFVPKVVWNNFIETGENVFKGYGNDLRDGFVHMSTHEQLYKTFTKYNNEDDKCYFKLLSIDLNVTDNVIWEKAKNGFIYPHAYSGIRISCDIGWVIDMDDYQFGANGI